MSDNDLKTSLALLQQSLSNIEQKTETLNVKLFGNGHPEESLCWQVGELTKKVDDVSNSLATRPCIKTNECYVSRSWMDTFKEMVVKSPLAFAIIIIALIVVQPAIPYIAQFIKLFS